MRSLCVLALLLAAGCSRCGGPRSAQSAEELLPQRPSGAVVTAPLAAVGQHLAALADRAGALPGGEQLVEMRKSLAAQLGFDPLTREGQLAAGLDPDRGAAVAILSAGPRPDWVAALPLTKPDLFAQTLQRLLVGRLGAAPGTDPHVFERGGVSIAWRVERGYGLIARGESARGKPPESAQSLAHAPGLVEMRRQLGAQDFVVWAPQGSDLPKRYTPRALPGDVAVSMQGSAQGTAMRLFAQLPPADAARVQSALPGGGASLVELLPAEAPVRARLGIAPERLLESARRVPEVAALLQRLQGADAEVLASIAPGAAISLALEKTANIGLAMDYGLDFRRRSPFETVQLVAVARPADLPRLIKAFEKIAKILPSLGGRVERKGDDFQVSYAAGKGPRFGVREIEGKPVAYLLGGSLRPDELRRTPRPANPESAALYVDNGATLRADFGKLAAAVAALPESAYGSGPQAYVARSLVTQVILPLRPLRLTLGAEAYPDHLGASLDVEIAAP